MIYVERALLSFFFLLSCSVSTISYEYSFFLSHLLRYPPQIHYCMLCLYIYAYLHTLLSHYFSFLKVFLCALLFSAMFSHESHLRRDFYRSISFPFYMSIVGGNNSNTQSQIETRSLLRLSKRRSTRTENAAKRKRKKEWEFCGAKVLPRQSVWGNGRRKRERGKSKQGEKGEKNTRTGVHVVLYSIKVNVDMAMLAVN